jgi:GT2 family glycosyltransferase
MFSIVAVYNKKDVLDEFLIKGLLLQSVPYELIALDNSSNQYQSVVDAFNYGGSIAKGKYVMFVHQDVKFLSPTWLEDTERLLDTLPNLGAAGPAGISREARDGSYLHSWGRIEGEGDAGWGEINSPVKVQTLDELLFIAPREVFLKNKFDAKTFDFIHLYGVDYCLNVAEQGLYTYAVPGPIFHKSSGTFVNLDRYRVRVFLRHHHASPIFTSTGEISYRTIWKFMFLATLPVSVATRIKEVRKNLFLRKKSVK